MLRVYRCRVVSYYVILLRYWRERLEFRNQLTSGDRCCQENALQHHLLPLYSVYTLWLPIQRFTKAGTIKEDVYGEQSSNQELNDDCREGRESCGAVHTQCPTERRSRWNCLDLIMSSITKQHFVQMISWRASPWSQVDNKKFQRQFLLQSSELKGQRNWTGNTKFHGDSSIHLQKLHHEPNQKITIPKLTAVKTGFSHNFMFNSNTSNFFTCEF